MELLIHSRHIDEILQSSDRGAQQAVMLLDRYTSLNSDNEREAFVGALIHRVLTEQARRRAIYANEPPHGLPTKQRTQS